MAVAAGVVPASTLHVDSTQPSPSYPVGQAQGENAKVAGRLFNIDGKVEYFAGV